MDLNFTNMYITIVFPVCYYHTCTLYTVYSVQCTPCTWPVYILIEN